MYQRRRQSQRGSIEVIWFEPLGSGEPIKVRRKVGRNVFEREVGPRGWLDVQEAAVALVNADRTTVYRLIKEGILKAARHEGRIFVTWGSVEAHLIRAAQQRRGRRLGVAWKPG